MYESNENLEDFKEGDDDSGDEGDTLGSIDSWYEVITPFIGSAENQELTLRKGNRISIQHKDASGYWFGINLATHQVGWIDPAMLRQIAITSDVLQKQLEQALTYSLSKYQGDSMENDASSSNSPADSSSDRPSSKTKNSGSNLTSSTSSGSGFGAKTSYTQPMRSSTRQDPPSLQTETSSSSEDWISPTSSAPKQKGTGLLAAVVSGSAIPLSSGVTNSSGSNPRIAGSHAAAPVNPTLPGTRPIYGTAGRATTPAKINPVDTRQHSDSGESETSIASSASRITAKSVLSTAPSFQPSSYTNYSSIPKSVGSVGISTLNSDPELSSSYSAASSAPVTRPITNRVISSETRSVSPADSRVIAEAKVSEFKPSVPRGGKTRIGDTAVNNPKFKVVIAYAGNASTKELQLIVGDIITITQKHESGYWYGKSSKLEKSGWVDPANVEPI
jgi:hypothetical protein